MPPVLEALDPTAGCPDPIAAAELIGEILNLGELRVTGARFVGRGGGASVDVDFNDGSRLSFEHARDIAKPMTLKTELAAQFGLARKINGEQTIQVIAALHTIAEHQESFDADEIARDRGTTYLQVADVIDVDMEDQVERWGAFTMLKDVDPVALRNLGEASSIAAGAPVLRHADDGTRYVRAGWFRTHVKTEESVSSTELAMRMQRVGWQRRGESGRIKATRPGFKDHVLAWSFYTVPSGWEAGA